MAIKTPKQTVIDKHPNAYHISMGFGKVKIHSVYSNVDMKGLLGQSTLSQRDAWLSAKENIKEKL